MLVVGIMELKGPAMPLIAVPYYLEIVIGFFWFLNPRSRIRFLCADPPFGPGNQIADVRLVTPDEQQGNPGNRKGVGVSAEEQKTEGG